VEDIDKDNDLISQPTPSVLYFLIYAFTRYSQFTALDCMQQLKVDQRDQHEKRGDGFYRCRCGGYRDLLDEGSHDELGI
jgi:hypothetical protein